MTGTAWRIFAKNCRLRSSARCMCGSQYVWEGHGFPDNGKEAARLLHRSVEQGSALGVLVSLRSGELPEFRERKMPFSSIQEAFDIVL